MCAFPVACQEAPPCTTQAVTQHIAVTESPPTNEPPRFVSSAVPTDSEKYPYNHVACIAEMPGEDLLVVWVAGSREAARDTAIVASRRRKNETTWSPPKTVADKADAGDANPTIFVDDRGAAWLFHVELFGEGNLCLSRVVVQTSGDGGETWTASHKSFEAICTLVKNKPIITRTGRWILPAYQEAIYQSQFWLSDDRGQTWQAAAPLLTLPNNNLQPAVVELADGSLYSLMRNGAGTGFTWEGRSTDCGKTWKLAERHDLPNPGSGIDLIRLADGRVLLAHNPSKKERTPLSVSVSADDGRTWSSPKTIESGPPQLSYPSLIQTHDGMIHLVYSHQLSHIQHASFNTAWLSSPAADQRP